MERILSHIPASTAIVHEILSSPFPMNSNTLNTLQLVETLAENLKHMLVNYTQGAVLLQKIVNTVNILIMVFFAMVALLVKEAVDDRLAG